MPGNILSFINNVSIREEIQKIFNCSNKILKYEKVQYLFVCLFGYGGEITIGELDNKEVLMRMNILNLTIYTIAIVPI